MRTKKLRQLDTEIASALDRFDELPAPRRRHLRQGERVPLPKDIGLPGGMIAGTNVEVIEYPDGAVTPILENLGDLMEILFRHFVSLDRLLTGPELAYVRRHVGYTQEDFAELLGMARETLCRHEKRAGTVPYPVSRMAGAIAIMATIKNPDSPTRDEQQLLAKMGKLVEVPAGAHEAREEYLRRPDEAPSARPDAGNRSTDSSSSATHHFLGLREGRPIETIDAGQGASVELPR